VAPTVLGELMPASAERKVQARMRSAG